MAKTTSKAKGSSARSRVGRTSTRASSRGSVADIHPSIEDASHEDEMELAAADDEPQSDELDGDALEGDDDESLRLDPGLLASAGSGAGALAVAPPASRRVAPPEALLRIPGAQFIYESYLELTKVTWPTFDAARNMTLVVIAFSAAVAIMVAIADLAFSHVLGWLLGLGS